MKPADITTPGMWKSPVQPFCRSIWQQPPTHARHRCYIPNRKQQEAFDLEWFRTSNGSAPWSFYERCSQSSPVQESYTHGKCQNLLPKPCSTYTVNSFAHKRLHYYLHSALGPSIPPGWQILAASDDERGCNGSFDKFDYVGTASFAYTLTSQA